MESLFWSMSESLLRDLNLWGKFKLICSVYGSTVKFQCIIALLWLFYFTRPNNFNRLRARDQVFVLLCRLSEFCIFMYKYLNVTLISIKLLLLSSLWMILCKTQCRARGNVCDASPLSVCSDINCPRSRLKWRWSTITVCFLSWHWILP